MFHKRIKLREYGGNVVITIPRGAVRGFRMAVGSHLDMYVNEQTLTVDLTSAEKTKLLDQPAKVPEAQVPDRDPTQPAPTQ